MEDAYKKLKMERARMSKKWNEFRECLEYINTPINKQKRK